MKNSEKLKKELENIKPSEELINKTKNKIQNLNYYKKNTYIKPALAILCTIILSVIIANNYLANNGKNFENEKIAQNKEYSSLFLKKIDEQITEEDTKKLILTVENEDINIENFEIYQKIMGYIEKFTGESRNLSVTSSAYFNMDTLKSFYGLYEKKLILVTINDKYMIRIPYKENSAITIIDLKKEKFTHYNIYPDENNDSYKYLNELREYIINEFNLEKEVQDEKQNELENKEETPTEVPDENNQEPHENNQEPHENKPVSKTYGDVNRDGIINSSDVSMIRRYVAATGNGGLSGPNEIKAADVNADGEITGLDATLLEYSIAGLIEFDGKNPIKNVTLYGDVSESGKIEQYDYTLLNQYINGETALNKRQLLCADINSDGKIDLTDLNLLEGVINGYFTLDIINPLTNYTLYGDVDCNGKIQAIDASFLKQYLSGMRELDEQQKKNADVNTDGIIDETDVKLIQEFGVRKHPDTLPFKPIK